MGRYVSSSRISQVGGSESTKVNPHYGRADWQYKNNSLAASGASSCSALGFDPKKSRYQNRCLYTTPGLYQFTVPSGVTTINTVVVGPGGYADHTLLPMCVDIRLMPASWFCCSRCCSDNNNNSYHARNANEWLGWGSYCGMPCNNPYQHLNAGAPVDAVGPSCVSLEAGMCVHEHAGDPCMRGGCISCGCGQWTPYRVGFYEQWGQDLYHRLSLHVPAVESY